MSKTVLFQTVQYSISTQFSSIWPIDRTLSGATTLSQTGPVSDGNDCINYIYIYIYIYICVCVCVCVCMCSLYRPIGLVSRVFANIYIYIYIYIYQYTIITTIAVSIVIFPNSPFLVPKPLYRSKHLDE